MPAISDTPIAVGAFAQRLSAFDLQGHVALAISGGRDSMALAYLISAADLPNISTTTALIVDHGLRPGSQEEAMETADQCRALGLSAEILRWEGDKPKTGIQAAARRARYRLLVKACVRIGAHQLLTGHTADDQAETVLMRMMRGGGPRALSGMSDETVIAADASPPIRLIRPMLEFSRAQTGAVANAHGVKFIDDPSNEDEQFERVRLRRLIAREGGGLFHTLLSTAQSMSDAAAALEEYEAARFDALGGAFTKWGGAVLRGKAYASQKIDGQMIARLLRAVAGADHRPPPHDAGAAFMSALERGAATLGGVLIVRRRDKIYFLREPAAVLGRADVTPLAPAMLHPGAAMIYDRRAILTNHGPDTVTIAPLGCAPRETVSEVCGGFDGPREAALALPAVLRPDGASAGIAGDTGHLRLEWLASRQFRGPEILRF